MKTLKRPQGKRVRLTTPPNPTLFREPGGVVRHIALPERKRRFKPKRVNRPAPVWMRFVARHVETLLLFSVLTVLGLSLWFSPRTRLQSIQVVGAPASVQGTLLQEIQRLYTEAPTPRAFEQGVQQYSWIQKAEWRRLSPSTAQIRLQPRQGLVEIRAPQSEKKYIDPAGFVFTAPNDLPQEPIGTIRVLETQMMPSDGSIRSGEMRRAYEVVRALSGDPRLQRVQLDLYPEGAQVLQLRRASTPAQSLQVRLGDALQWREQVAVIRELLEAPSDELRQWLYIDLKSPKAPAIRFRSNPIGGEQ